MYNPFFLGKIAKHYFYDANLVWTMNEKQMRTYQDKLLRRIVKYAYTVPAYHEKYKKHGIHPSDIKGIKDIRKLPLITKSDLMDNFPDGIIPANFNKEDGFLESTSGSTGKPVSVYSDFFSAVKSLMFFQRVLKAYGGSWKKSKIALVVDLDPGTEENVVFTKSATPFLKKFVDLNNLRYIHIDKKTEEIMQELDDFKPDFLGSDPGMFKKLASLKNDGKGKNVEPKYLVSSSAVLDNYNRKYVEKAFNAKIMDTYGATETGPMTFQCVENEYYHVNPDYVFLEFLDESEKPVDYGKIGQIVATKLYGKGTPIIRYIGLDDLAAPIDESCTCGVKTQLMGQIEGRRFDSIVLSNGKMLTPLSLTTIPRAIMDRYQLYKIKQFQIIQHKIDEIEILVVIDERLRNVGPSVKKLSEEIKKEFSKIVGADVRIAVNEVKDIENQGKADKVKVVISNVKAKQAEID